MQFTDFLLLSDNFGGSNSVSTVSVPELRTYSLVLVTMLGFLHRRAAFHRLGE